MELEKTALKDEYFVKRRLYPNVDFYSGICFRALKIPVEMFTVIFAVARSIGWVSQWREMAAEETKISRPRQMYMGEMDKRFVSVAERGGSSASDPTTSCSFDEDTTHTETTATKNPLVKLVDVQVANPYHH